MQPHLGATKASKGSQLLYDNATPKYRTLLRIYRRLWHIHGLSNCQEEPKLGDL